MVEFADQCLDELEIVDGFLLIFAYDVRRFEEVDGYWYSRCGFDNIGGRVEVAVGDDVVPKF